MNTFEQKIILLPLSYLSPIGFFSICAKASRIQFEIDETYPKQTIRNHCNILTSNGIQKLSIPVFRSLGSKSKTREIQLLHLEKWQNLHWKALTTAYNKSPYFEHYGFRIKKILDKKHPFLYQLNIDLIGVIFKILQMDIEIALSESWQKEVENCIDLRNFDFEKSKIFIELSDPYYQVFSDRQDFHPNLSILDLIFNEGPAGIQYIHNLSDKILLESMY